MEYHTVVFGDGRYKTLMEVLRRSVESNSEHKLVVHEIPYRRRHGSIKLTTNTDKLKKWNDIVQEAEGNIVLMDCDTLLLKDVSHVFNMDFDVAYTKRTAGERFPLNGGVVFVRANKETKAFFKEWLEVNNRMMSDSDFHRPYYKKYAGINQASFGHLLEKGPNIDIIDVPCRKYNACDVDDWNNLEDTHILHIKSDLQNQCFTKTPFRHHEAVGLWRRYYRH